MIDYKWIVNFDVQKEYEVQLKNTEDKLQEVERLLGVEKNFVVIEALQAHRNKLRAIVSRFLKGGAAKLYNAVEIETSQLFDKHDGVLVGYSNTASQALKDISISYPHVTFEALGYPYGLFESIQGTHPAIQIGARNGVVFVEEIEIPWLTESMFEEKLKKVLDENSSE